MNVDEGFCDDVPAFVVHRCRDCRALLPFPKCNHDCIIHENNDEGIDTETDLGGFRRELKQVFQARVARFRAGIAGYIQQQPAQ